MNTFLTTVWKSIYGPGFYASHRQRTLGSAWRYFTTLSAGVALLVSIAFSIVMVPRLNDALSKAPMYVMQAYPDELVLTFENGIARSNVVEPYYVSYPEIWTKDWGERATNLPKYLAVIETGKSTSDARIPDVKSSSALIHVYADGIMIAQEDGTFRTEQFIQKGRPTHPGVFILNKEQVEKFVTEAKKYFGYIPPIVVAMIFVTLLIFYGIVLAFVAFIAFFIMLLGKLLRKEWTYAESLKLGFYSATLPLILYSALPPIALVLGIMGFAGMMLGVLVVNFGFDRNPSVNPIAASPAISEDPNKGK
jgi:hypothetical protein